MHKCEILLKNMPELKEHLKEHFETECEKARKRAARREAKTLEQKQADVAD